MADDSDAAGHDPAVTNYFLDVLSSGLGAAILLFMIFAVLPHYGESGATKSTGEGQEQTVAAAGGPAGAVNELEQLAGRAYVTFFVEVESLGGVAINPTARSWPGLRLKPGEVDEVAEPQSAKPTLMRFRAACRKGLSPANKVEFHLTDLAVSKAKFRVKIEACVGAAQRKEAVFTPVDGGKALTRQITFPTGVNPQPADQVIGAGPSIPIVRFDLTNKGDWIVFPNS